MIGQTLRLLDLATHGVTVSLESEYLSLPGARPRPAWPWQVPGALSVRSGHHGAGAAGGPRVRET